MGLKNADQQSLVRLSLRQYKVLFDGERSSQHPFRCLQRIAFMFYTLL